VFPENDPRFLGVTGSSLPPGARKALEKSDVVLALGTDFDGLTTSDWELPMGDELVHITLDPAAIGGSYEPAVGIVDDVAVAAATLRERLSDFVPSTRWDPVQIGRAVCNEYREQLRSKSLLDEGPPIHTPALLETVRNTIPDETIVTTDIGGFRLWTMQAFEAYEPEAFIAAGSWAGMGVGLPAAIGAKLARPNRPVVCCSGDGGLLMCLQELATAIEEDLDIILVVSNNNDYGIISKSPKIETETDDHAFSWSSPSFPAIAEGFGWMAESVEETSALETALESALDCDEPTLIDVSVPTEEPSAAAAATFSTEVAIDSSFAHL
jgi:acetolactate synthase-1/2/3 large subunit